MGTPKIWTQEAIEKEAESLEEWLKKPDSLYFCDFVLEKPYGPDKISAFAKENERFREARAKAQMMQERKLMDGGLTRKYDSSFCKFTMQNVCRWHDKQTIVTEVRAAAIDPSAVNSSRDPLDDAKAVCKDGGA